ncbi:L-serine ammonia-lyase, iron-sulfur-dependent, subunit alpha [Parabacteroides sp. OttesenSCG-928-G07]|nr:L-serine ammonia-lyase, iron-sulfur-dependent, subunit alpha [Parabacteroides sp. OttesenSCG-928-G07]
MEQKTRKQIIDLIHREVVPAIGCTEPVAVALASAKAAEVLGRLPEKIEVFLSANVLKNAMGVGVPGTGMVGLPIAIALGVVVGKSAYGLEVLRDVDEASLKVAQSMISNKIISIAVKEEVDTLYIEVICSSGNESATTIISGQHNKFVRIEKNQEVLLDEQDKTMSTDCPEEPVLSYSMVYEFAATMPLEEIRFVMESAQINKKASEEAMHTDYGHTVGKIITSEAGQKYMGNSPFTRMIARTAAACDARMDGAMIPIMTNSGSGNQGIAATLPVLSFAEDNGIEEDKLIRALALSHLMVIYTKQHLGRLSALCGCVVAATGASCGITYLMGGTKEQIAYAIKNMIGNLTGMICDGAKPSCALKVSSGVSTAMLSALLAMENKVVTPVEGIIDEDVDKSITNLTDIGSKGMVYTDRLVVDIMTGK